MANRTKVLDSIKCFLERIKAHDEDIPEEIGNDALEMVEEVKDALEEEEVEVKEKDEDKCNTEDEEEEKDLEKKVEDAIGKALRKYGLVRDGSMEALDELENKLGEEKEEDEDSEEGVVVDPEKINDSAKLRLIRKVKPIIANVSDAKSRRILSNSFVKAMSMNSDTADYGSIYNLARSNAKDSMSKNMHNVSAEDFGMDIAKRYNPHYKEEN